MARRDAPTRIVITGASRGIGAALASTYAGPGVSLLLVGRDRDRLAGICTMCRGRGAVADALVRDTRDAAGLAAELLAFDGAAPVDLVIANAGVALPTVADPAVDTSVRGEVDINIGGTLNTVLPLLPALAGRGRGQVAIVSSLAAFAPLPGSPGYSASKAALLVYGLALRQRLAQTGIGVSVVCPGYVETEMGARYRGWRPFLMSADAAAARLRRGLAADRALIAFPVLLAWAARASQFVPEPVLRRALRAFRFSVDRPG